MSGNPKMKVCPLLSSAAGGLCRCMASECMLFIHNPNSEMEDVGDCALTKLSDVSLLAEAVRPDIGNDPALLRVSVY